MMGLVQCLITIALLVAGCSARAPLGARGIRYYTFGGDGFHAKQGNVTREWKSDAGTGKSPTSQKWHTDAAIGTKWFPNVYRTHRYVPGGISLWFELFVLPNEYSVQLLFCETYFDAVNKRKFKIKINNMWYVDGKFTSNANQATVIDIYRMAGGKNRPIVLTVNRVNALKGSIYIEIIPVENNAFLSGAIIAPIHNATQRNDNALWSPRGNANA